MSHAQNRTGEVVPGGTTLYVHEGDPDAGTADTTRLLPPRLVPIESAAPTEFAPGAYKAPTRPLPPEAQPTEYLPGAADGTPDAMLASVMREAIAAMQTIPLDLDQHGQPATVHDLLALLKGQSELAERVAARLSTNAYVAEQLRQGRELAEIVAQAWGVPAVVVHLNPLPAPGYEED